MCRDAVRVILNSMFAHRRIIHERDPCGGMIIAKSRWHSLTAIPLHPGLENYTFLTPKFSIQRTNIYADANEQILEGFLTHHGMQSILSVGVSQNQVLRNFGVELLPALFLLLVYTQPAMGYGVDFLLSKPSDRFAANRILSQQKIF